MSNFTMRSARTSRSAARGPFNSTLTKSRKPHPKHRKEDITYFSKNRVLTLGGITEDVSLTDQAADRSRCRRRRAADAPGSCRRPGPCEPVASTADQRPEPVGEDVSLTDQAADRSRCRRRRAADTPGRAGVQAPASRSPAPPTNGQCVITKAQRRNS